MPISPVSSGADLKADWRVFQGLSCFDKADSLTTINLLTQRRPPPFVLKIPLNRLGKASGERLVGTPAEFAFELRGIDCVTMIMTRAIRHKGNVPGVRNTIRIELIEHSANAFDHFKVCAFVPPT